jgi:hypothetical protein
MTGFTPFAYFGPGRFPMHDGIPERFEKLPLR